MAPSPFSRQRAERGGRTSNGLDRVPLLAMLDPELRKRVRKRLNRRRVSAGKLLWRQGETADALYLIDAGRVRVFVPDRAGRERVLRFHGPGDVVGEAAFIAETPHISSAAAVEDTTVWRLERPDFDALIGKHEPALRYLANIVAERQAQANARLAAETAPEEARASRGFVTALFSPRGGAGVTTLAVALSVALAERHPDDAVLLDLDVLFGDAPAALLLQPRGVLATLTPNSILALERAGLDHYLLTHPSSLRVLPAASRPEEGQSVTADHVRAALNTLRRHFGFIVVDLAHDFSEVTLAALELADRVLVVATPERATLQDIVECRRIFSDVLQLPSDRVGYLLNHPLPYAGVAGSEFTAATGAPWAEVPYGGDGPSIAALRGESLLTNRRNNPVARAAVSLAETITSEARELAALSGHTV